MSGRKYRLTNRAISDLEEIAEYLSERSTAACVRVLESLHETFRIVAQDPAIGESLDHYRFGVRKSMGIRPAHNYVIIYSVQNDQVSITRVLHSARDWVALVQDEPG
jgi:toxin ParE1/3/4